MANLLDPRYRAIGVWDPLTGTGDAAAAIQQANDDLPANGGVVDVSPALIRYASTIRFTKRIQLRCSGGYNGSGRGGATTFVKASSLNGPGFLVLGGNGAVFSDFLLDGEPGNGGDGIVVNAPRVRFAGVSSHHQGQDGWRFGSDTGVNVNSWRVLDCSGKFNGRHGGYWHDGKYDCNAGIASGFEGSQNGADGIRVGQSYKNSFMAYLTEANGVDGVHCVPGATENSFFAGDPNETNHNRDIHVEAGATRNVFYSVPLATTVTNSDPSTVFVGSPGRA